MKKAVEPRGRRQREHHLDDVALRRRLEHRRVAGRVAVDGRHRMLHADFQIRRRAGDADRHGPLGEGQEIGAARVLCGGPPQDRREAQGGDSCCSGLAHDFPLPVVA
jgi:hypothetical protein